MWWKNVVPKHLPLPKGPHAVGCIDVLSGFSKESSLIRIYYPSEKSQEDEKSKWFKWCPHDKYLDGFAFVANLRPIFLKLGVWYNGGEPLVPAAWEGKPFNDSQTKYPVILYSHGFGAVRFISSTIGIELASHGYIFASIEHREHSACTTFYYESEEKLKNNEPTWIPHKKIEFGPDHYSVRNKQLHERKNELINVINLLEEINEGTAKNILPTSFDLTGFKGLLDMNSLFVMGHSFGGAASLLTLYSDERLKCGVILDGWMFPLKEEDVTINKPLLFINTQTFHIESNLLVMDKFIKGPKDCAREVYTIKHTTHESQTDMTHIVGYWLNWFMHKLDPVIGTNINNHLILRFFNKLTEYPLDIEQSNKYLLEHNDDIINGTFLYSKQASRDFSIKDQILANKL